MRIDETSLGPGGAGARPGRGFERGFFLVDIRSNCCWYALISLHFCSCTTISVRPSRARQGSRAAWAWRRYRDYSWTRGEAERVSLLRMEACSPPHPAGMQSSVRERPGPNTCMHACACRCSSPLPLNNSSSGRSGSRSSSSGSSRSSSGDPCPRPSLKEHDRGGMESSRQPRLP
jgi:hypothetical protein